MQRKAGRPGRVYAGILEHDKSVVKCLAETLLVWVKMSRNKMQTMDGKTVLDLLDEAAGALVSIEGLGAIERMSKPGTWRWGEPRTIVAIMSPYEGEARLSAEIFAAAPDQVIRIAWSGRNVETNPIDPH